MTTDKVLSLDTAKILADNNVRFGVLAVEHLASDIEDQGGVLYPVLVSKLAKPANGHTHRLIDGYRRLGAVELLNARGAGLKLPAIEVEDGDEVTNLKTQVRANNERQSLSPIDTAMACKRLLDAGVPSDEVRVLFSRPTGKKLEFQPASPAWLRQTLKFLELPKKVQTAIHEGRVGVAAAYELLRYDPERRQEIIEKAEAARARMEEQDAKELDKLKAEQEKEGAIAEKVAAATAEVTAAEKALADAKVLHGTRAEAHKKARITPPDYLDFNADQKKAFAEASNATKADLRASEKAVADAEKELTRAQEAHKKLTAPKVAAPKAAPKKAVGPAEVKKAAKETGAKPDANAKKERPMTAADLREMFGEMKRSKLSEVKAIGTLLDQAAAGSILVKDAVEQITALVAPKPAKKR